MTSGSLQSYQIVLIVILVLNLLFWVFVICWRLFMNKHDQSQQRRNRNAPLRRRFAYRNTAFSANITNTSENDGREPDFPHIDVDFEQNLPPAYEEAIKYPSPFFRLNSVNFSSNVLSNRGLTETDTARSLSDLRVSTIEELAATENQHQTNSEMDITPTVDSVAPPDYSDITVLPTRMNGNSSLGPPGKYIWFLVLNEENSSPLEAHDISRISETSNTDNVYVTESRAGHSTTQSVPRNTPILSYVENNESNVSRPIRVSRPQTTEFHENLNSYACSRGSPEIMDSNFRLVASLSNDEVNPNAVHHSALTLEHLSIKNEDLEGNRLDYQSMNERVMNLESQSISISSDTAA
ncbi:uncharacterized protein LOC111085598 [Limulus polyphemus]|uniref:Uncharacterized protein LOC111085598 n=1 Tax=Limulus polyphemus TaxID=6850 RepID=A0ABM1SAG8_LIMPO|nr:uncharacterized protein LOC111085598 [Limulus polyphemus]